MQLFNLDKWNAFETKQHVEEKEGDFSWNHN